MLLAHTFVYSKYMVKFGHANGQGLIYIWSIVIFMIQTAISLMILEINKKNIQELNSRKSNMNMEWRMKMQCSLI